MISKGAVSPAMSGLSASAPDVGAATKGTAKVPESAFAAWLALVSGSPPQQQLPPVAPARTAAQGPKSIGAVARTQSGAVQAHGLRLTVSRGRLSAARVVQRSGAKSVQQPTSGASSTKQRMAVRPTQVPAKAVRIGSNAHLLQASVVQKPGPFSTRPTPLTGGPAPLGTTPTPLGTRPAPLGTTPAPLGTTPTPLGTRPAPLGTRPVMDATPTPLGTRPTPLGTTPMPLGARPTPLGTRLVTDAVPSRSVPGGSVGAPAQSVADVLTSSSSASRVQSTGPPMDALSTATVDQLRWKPVRTLPGSTDQANPSGHSLAQASSEAPVARAQTVSPVLQATVSPLPKQMPLVNSETTAMGIATRVNQSVLVGQPSVVLGQGLEPAAMVLRAHSAGRVHTTAATLNSGRHGAQQDRPFGDGGASTSGASAPASGLPGQAVVVDSTHEPSGVSGPAFQFGQPNAIQQLAATVGQRMRMGQHQIKVQVHPQGLGSVQITATQSRGSVLVQVVASNPVVAAALHHALPDLRDAIQAQGVDVSGLTVSLGDASLAGGDTSSGGQSGREVPQLPQFVPLIGGSARASDVSRGSPTTAEPGGSVINLRI